MSPEVLQGSYGHQHPEYLKGAAAAIGQKGRIVSVVESVVGLTEGESQRKNANDFWSEWQDSNLRPLRPEPYYCSVWAEKSRFLVLFAFKWSPLFST